MKGKTKITWAEIDKFISTLATDVRGSGFRNIYGIPRGGLIPAVMLSHKLNLPLTNKITKYTLIIDDICDTGKTLRKNKKGYTAALVLKENAKWWPDFYAQMFSTKNWIVFPWETLKSTK